MGADGLPVLHQSLLQRLLERGLIVVEQDTEQPLVRCQCASVVQLSGRRGAYLRVGLAQRESR